MPCCRRYADRANTYVRTYHATTGHTRPPRTQTSAALRQDGPPPPTPPPHPRLWASSSASASSKVQAAGFSGWQDLRAQARRRGRFFGQCGCVCDWGQGCSRGRDSGLESSRSCHSESIAEASELGCEISSSVHEHKDKKDSGQSNDRSGARDNRKTPRGRKNGGRAWWSRRQREARILAAFKDQYATLVPVLGPTWHGPQNLFVMEKKNQAAILCLIRTVDRGIWSQGRKCKDS